MHIGRYTVMTKLFPDEKNPFMNFCNFQDGLFQVTGSVGLKRGRK